MITLIVTILAVWRASLLITEEEGPFGIFTMIRNRTDPYQKTWIGRGINCVWCVSWWAGVAAASWLCYFGVIGLFAIPVWWFGTSGGAVLLQAVLDRLRAPISRGR